MATVLEMERDRAGTVLALNNENLRAAAQKCAYVLSSVQSGAWVASAQLAPGEYAVWLRGLDATNDVAVLCTVSASAPSQAFPTSSGETCSLFSGGVVERVRVTTALPFVQVRTASGSGLTVSLCLIQLL